MFFFTTWFFKVNLTFFNHWNACGEFVCHFFLKLVFLVVQSIQLLLKTTLFTFNQFYLRLLPFFVFMICWFWNITINRSLVNHFYVFGFQRLCSVFSCNKFWRVVKSACLLGTSKILIFTINVFLIYINFTEWTRFLFFHPFLFASAFFGLLWLFSVRRLFKVCFLKISVFSLWLQILIRLRLRW